MSERFNIGASVVFERTRARVQGTYSFTGLTGTPGIVSSYVDHPESDPCQDESAVGYLLLSEYGQTIRAPWASKDIGDLTRVVYGHLRLVKNA